MRTIKKYVKLIDEEIHSAKLYAENYVEFKSKSNLQKANKFKEMATDELKHAEYFHDFAMDEITELKMVYTAPVDMEEKWDHEHRKYIEQVAYIRQILTM